MTNITSYNSNPYSPQVKWSKFLDPCRGRTPIISPYSTKLRSLRDRNLGYERYVLKRLYYF
jgi:hypothetical protein